MVGTSVNTPPDESNFQASNLKYLIIFIHIRNISILTQRIILRFLDYFDKKVGEKTQTARTTQGGREKKP
jgi:hypothetical protein